MTSKISFAAIAVLSVSHISCTSIEDAAEKHGQRAVAWVQTFNLPPKALKDAEDAAREGSAEAAIKLSEYHGFVRLDIEKQIYWMKKAVKLGARDEQENLDTLLEVQAERRAVLKRRTSAAP